MKQTRVWLFLSSCLVLALVVGWLLLVIRFQPDELQPVLIKSLCFLGLTAAVGVAMFCLKGPIFYPEGAHEGGLRRRSIVLVLAILLCTVQIAMTFTIFFWHYVGFMHDLRVRANEIFEASRPVLSAPKPDISDLEPDDNFSVIHVIAAKDGTVLSSTAEGMTGKTLKPDPLSSYRFPHNDVELVAEISTDKRWNGALSLLLQLFTVAAGSMIMTGEMILLCLGIIERRRGPAAPEESEAEVAAGEDKGLIALLRPLSFLLCFASRLCSSFLPVMAEELPGSIPGFSAQAAAGLPQSAELLLTCAAIVFTPGMLKRLGWKPPFFVGLLIVAAGSLLSALAGNILLLVVSRAVVGLGYGFCWMTLRNLCMMTKDEEAGKLGLLMLVCGIYAGVTCGTALGSLLAELLGFQTVLLISAGLMLLFALAVMPMQNTFPVAQTKSAIGQAADRAGKKSRWWGAAAFLMFIVVPCSVALSFTGTYVPLYFSEIGRSIGDTGSCQLLYGLTVIYMGPFFNRVLNKLSPFASCMVGNLFMVVALLGFGFWGGFAMALIAAIVLGITEIISSGSQNFYILSLPSFLRLDKITAFTLISLLKKFFEAIGPTAFAFTAGFGPNGVATMGKIFLISLLLYMAWAYTGRLFRRA